MEGMATDKQHIRLEDFLCELKALQDALNCIDREVNGRETLYYRVVDLTHSSPATVRLEMVLREPFRKPTLRQKYANSVDFVHDRFFESLNAIRFKNERIENTREETIEAFSDLVSGLGSAFASGAIYNSAANIPLDAGLLDNINSQTKSGFKSNGSITGDLLAISFAKGNRFYIYPQIGPTSVACHFNDNEQMEKKARSCIKKRVRVFGEKFFRPSTGLPFKVIVQKIEEITPPKTFVTLNPERHTRVSVPSHESIANLRNEWKA